MTKILQQLYQEVQEDHPYVVALRRHFHQHPETAKEEFETQKRIEEELDLIGIPHTRVAGTGVIGWIEGCGPETAGNTANPEASGHDDAAQKENASGNAGASAAGSTKGSKTIVLRADIDALPVLEANDVPYKSEVPGKMHACGHDAHTAGLLGAARILMKNRDKFAGKIELVFQPGEEIGYGGRIIVNEGHIDGADRTFGIHMASNIPAGNVAIVPGPNNASTDWFNIHIDGLGAHVSTPEKGIDAAYIAGQILVGVQGLVTRMTSPMDNVLIGIGKVTAGEAYNVVAKSADLEGTIRALTPETRQQAMEHLETFVAHTAAIYGAKASMEWQNFCVPLINDKTSSEEAQKVAKGLLGEEHVITSRPASLGGDDMADFINRVPGVYAYVGSGNPENPNTMVAHHNDHFDIDETALTVSTALYTAYAIEFLNGNV